MRIGVAGSGSIVQLMLGAWEKIECVDVAAIWCREHSAVRTRELAAAHGVTTVFTDYAEFLSCDDFDLVYIGLVNSAHYEYSKQALLAGKHVVCEKPLTCTEAEARELLEIACERGLFLFESVLPWYQPNYRAIKEHLGELGNMRLVQISFTQYSRRYEAYLAGKVLPAFDPALAGGCLMDIMTYSIHFTMGLFGVPADVRYFPNLGGNGIDLSGVLVMDYGSFKAVLVSAKDSSSTPRITIQGDAGTLEIPHIPLELHDIELSKRGEESKIIDAQPEAPGFECVWDTIAALISAGDLERCYAVAEQVVAVMGVMERARLGAGIVFPCDGASS